MPGSTTALQCSAACYPACTYGWIYNGRLVGVNASFSLTPVSQTDESPLTCVTYNSVTQIHSSVETTVVLLGEQQ